MWVFLVVNALSTDLKATVYRDGKVYEQNYQKGKPVADVKEVGTSDKRGTTVTFTPDASIFEIVDYNYETLASRLRELSFLNKGIKLTITDLRTTDEDGNHNKNEFLSQGGLKEFVLFLDESREQIIEDVIYMDGERNGIPVEVSMVYNNSYSENIHSYVNNINTHEGGDTPFRFSSGAYKNIEEICG